MCIGGELRNVDCRSPNLQPEGTDIISIKISILCYVHLEVSPVMWTVVVLIYNQRGGVLAST